MHNSLSGGKSKKMLAICRFFTFLSIQMIFAIFSSGCSDNKDRKEVSSLHDSSFIAIPASYSGSTLLSFVDSTVNAIGTEGRNAQDNIELFRQFLKNVRLQPEAAYVETIIDDLTGDGIKDTLINKLHIEENHCTIESAVYSRGGIVYSDKASFSPDDLYDIDVTWGSFELFDALMPYSLLYGVYSLRVQAFNMDPNLLNDELFMFLNLKKEEMMKEKIDSMSVSGSLKYYADYAKKYKGKFIHNISPMDYDTYIYDNKVNRFVVFYMP